MSLRGKAITELEVIFQQSMHDRRVLVALHEELARRSTPRARELRGEVRERLASAECGVPAELATGISNSKPWYRRGGVIFSAVGLAAAGVAQGICHAVGFHLWEPMWRSLQQVVGLVAGS
jgi:hypothetical protein